MSMNNKKEYLSVSDVNRYLYYKFNDDIALQCVYIQGELSNCKRSGQHYYFSLKDQNSEISAMFFYPANLTLHFIPQDGMSVQVVGKIQIYKKRGSYAVIVNQMTECGIGILYQKYLELKNKLEHEGLFAAEHKLPIPDYPENVGIITAPTGEAINDIVSTFNRRFPLAKLTLYPALVQGLDAPKDLIRALNLSYQNSDLDVLIIGRGGGSFEDLNCFNDEMLARKLYDAPFPTISAVGHEGDYTICDFVCSFRAPTPTGAAMRLTKDKKDVLSVILNESKRLKTGIKNKLISAYNNWYSLTNSFVLAHFDDVISRYEQKYLELDHKLNLLTPEVIAKKLDDEIANLQHRLQFSMERNVANAEAIYNNLKSHLRVELIINDIDNKRTIVDNLTNQIVTMMNKKIENLSSVFEHLVEKSTILNPLNIITKGYSIVYKDDKIVYNTSELQEHDNIAVKFADGKAFATINKIEKDK